MRFPDGRMGSPVREAKGPGQGDTLERVILTPVAPDRLPAESTEAAWSFLWELLTRGVEVPADGLPGIRKFPINREDFTQLYLRSSRAKEEDTVARIQNRAQLYIHEQT